MIDIPNNIDDDSQVDPAAPPDASAGGVDSEADKAEAEQKEIWKRWRARIDKCRLERRQLVFGWATNVDYRRGKPFNQDTDEDRVNVNVDWSLTKGKHAQLYSQTPQVYLTARLEQFKPAIAPFAKRLNERLDEANVGAAMDESVIDCINASGIGCAMVGYEARTATKDVPAVDTKGLTSEQVAQMYPQGVPTAPQDVIVDRRFFVSRFSPSDLLWPLEFERSDFDQAPWLGHTGRKPWPDAKVEFKLADEDKQKYCGEVREEDSLREDVQSTDSTAEEVVEYDEIFYWAWQFDENESYFKKIRRIVFLRGKEDIDPVIDEDWNGQQFDEQTGKYVGACKLPIRVLTLTYISDDAIPPSDTAVGRPQVLELIRTRTQIIQQRDRTAPVRWFDVNRVDPLIQDTLMRGEWQGMIPVQGDGTRVIGEIARANYPNEDYGFDRLIKGDLQEQWQLGSNQMGQFAQGERSASEAKIIQQNFQSRVGYERGRVAKFFVGIAEVMAGLIALYDDFSVLGAEGQQRIDSSWDRKHIAGEFVYYIRPDSTVLLDADDRIEKLMKVLNEVGKSGYVNPAPIIEEILALSGLDPAKIMTQPKDPAPDPPKISVSIKSEDLLNPLVIAVLMRSHQAPTPEDLQAAKNLLASLDMPVHTDGQPAAVPGGPQPLSPEQADKWGPAERITKRVNEIGG